MAKNWGRNPRLMRLQSCFAVLLILPLVAVPTQADDATISVPHIGPPSPSTVTVDPGDSVTWVKQSGYDKFIENSLGERICPELTGSNPSCTRVYPTSGIYRYKTIVSYRPEDTSNHYWGTIIVTGTPATSASFDTPAANDALQGEVAFAGTATDPDGIARVEYNAGGRGWRPATGTTSWSFDIDTTLHGRGNLNVDVRIYSNIGAERVISRTIMVDNPSAVDVQVSRAVIHFNQAAHGGGQEDLRWAIRNEGNEHVQATFVAEARNAGDPWTQVAGGTVSLAPFSSTGGATERWADNLYAMARVTITDIVSPSPDLFPDNNVGTWPQTHPGAAAMVRIGLGISAEPAYAQIPAGQQAGWQWRDGGPTNNYGGTLSHRLVTADGELCARSSADGHLCYRQFDAVGLIDYWCSSHPSQIQGQLRVLGAAPVAVIDAPLDGSTVSGPFTISGSTTAFHDVQSVDVQVGSLDWVPAAGTDSWSLVLDADDLPGGWQDITVLATDEFGQVGQATINLFLDSPVWPDLTVASLSSAPPLYANFLGGPVSSPVHELRAEVALAGPTDQTTDVLFEYFSNGNWHVLGTTTVTVPAGGSQTATIDWIDPTVFGRYNVRATVDPNNLLAEDGEDNNTAEQILLHAVWHRHELGKFDPLH